MARGPKDGRSAVADNFTSNRVAQPRWTVTYNIVSRENGRWIGHGWEFFDNEADADKCYNRQLASGNCPTRRHFHPVDWQHLGAAHERPVHPEPGGSATNTLSEKIRKGQCTAEEYRRMMGVTPAIHDCEFVRTEGSPLGYACWCGMSPPEGWYPEQDNSP